MQITQVPINKLIPYVNNARTHSDEQVSQIAASIKEFGFNNPVLVDNKLGIIAGHGRVLAAQKLGLSEVPTLTLSHLSDNQRKAYILADNRLAMNAGWDFNLLQVEFTDIMQAGIDIQSLGFADNEINSILNPVTSEPGLCDPDEIPAILPDAICKPNDIWLLGQHRLMCGDSVMLDNVDSLMAGKKATMLFTSPPYTDLRKYSGNDLSMDTLAGIFGVYLPYTEYFVLNLGLQFKNQEIYPYWDKWITAAHEAGLKFLAWNIWDKLQSGSIAQQSRMFALMHEWLFVFGHSPKELNRIWEKSESSEERRKYFNVNEHGQKVTSRRQKNNGVKYSTHGREFANKNLGSVLTCYSEQERTIEHPAKFPVHLPQPYIESMTNPNDIVIDCFGGSGSTLIACERAGRVCHMMEISPIYCDLVIKRWQKFTGKDGMLESTKQTFNEQANEEKENGSSKMDTT